MILVDFSGGESLSVSNQDLHRFTIVHDILAFEILSDDFTGNPDALSACIHRTPDLKPFFLLKDYSVYQERLSLSVSPSD